MDDSGKVPAVGLHPDRRIEAVRSLARASSVLERATAELSLAHYRVLAAIASGDERASLIARKLAVGKPTVSAAVEALCRRGLLARRAVAGDQRAAALALTAAGRAVLDQAEADMVIRLDDLCARTPDGRVLVDALVWLGAALDDRSAERHGAATAPGGDPRAEGRPTPPTEATTPSPRPGGAAARPSRPPDEPGRPTSPAAR